jgi:hypothetical protein
MSPHSPAIVTGRSAFSRAKRQGPLEPGHRGFGALSIPARVLVAATMICVCASIGRAAEPRLRLVHANRDGSQRLVRLQVWVRSSVPLGAYTFEASFDPVGLELVSLHGGTTAEFSPSPLVDRASFETGRVRFSAFQATRLDGPRGRVHVADLVFRRHPSPSRRRVHVEIRSVVTADTEGRQYGVRSRSRVLSTRIPLARSGAPTSIR